MKKNIKITVFILGFLLFSGAVYASVTTARTSGISKIPWQGTTSGDFTTAHHRGSSYVGDTSRFTNNGNGTISDSRTGLMWQNEGGSVEQTACKTYDTNSFTDTDCNDGNVGDDCNWCAAKEYCANLSLGGHIDWKLPNIVELESIVDYARTSSNYWYETYFTLVSYGYWSSTPYASDTGNARYLHFNLANTRYDPKVYNNYVLCAR